MEDLNRMLAKAKDEIAKDSKLSKSIKKLEDATEVKKVNDSLKDVKVSVKEEKKEK